MGKSKETDCSKPPCDTDGECCKEKQKQIDDCCPRDESCPTEGEKNALDERYESGDKTIRSPNKKMPFSDPLYLDAYLETLYGGGPENSERAECARERKCLLTPYDDADKVCCDGVTGHHIIPGSALKDSLGSCYNHGQALTTCMEGASNHKGPHGHMHDELRDRVKAIRVEAIGSPDRSCKTPYSKMLDAGVDSHSAATENSCDNECTKKMLEENVKQQCPKSFENGKDPNVDATWGGGPGDKNKIRCTAQHQTMIGST